MEPKRKIKKVGFSPKLIRESLGDIFYLSEEPMRRVRRYMDFGFGPVRVTCETPSFRSVNNNLRFGSYTPQTTDIYVNLQSIDFDSPTGQFLTSKIREGGSSKFNITLMDLDPTGCVISQWLLVGCYLTLVDFADNVFLNQYIEEDLNFGMRLSMDYFVLQI